MPNAGAGQLRAYLDAQRQTQEWLAEQLKITPAYVSMLLRGRIPSLRLASRIEALTGIPAAAFSQGPQP